MFGALLECFERFVQKVSLQRPLHPGLSRKSAVIFPSPPSLAASPTPPSTLRFRGPLEFFSPSTRWSFLFRRKCPPLAPSALAQILAIVLHLGHNLPFLDVAEPTFLDLLSRLLLISLPHTSFNGRSISSTLLFSPTRALHPVSPLQGPLPMALPHLVGRSRSDSISWY